MRIIFDVLLFVLAVILAIQGIQTLTKKKEAVENASRNASKRIQIFNSKGIAGTIAAVPALAAKDKKALTFAARHV